MGRLDHFDQLRHQARLTLMAIFVVQNGFALGVVYLCFYGFHLPLFMSIIASLVVSSILSLLFILPFSRYVFEPLKAVWQAIFHLSPDQHDIGPLKVEDIRFGHDLVVALTTQLYQLIEIAQKTNAGANDTHYDYSHNFVLQNLPLPLLVLDKNQNVLFANEATLEYLSLDVGHVKDKNLYDIFNASFPSESTLDVWMKKAQASKATAINAWERVRLDAQDNRPVRLFDLAAYYNRDNPGSIETLLVLFDHTAQYAQDDQGIGFIALSVHELRTPLTLLRGYLEVFEEELFPSLSPEMQDFMLKMRSTTEQLAAFVNNILNVARIDNDQLELHLQSEDWSDIIDETIDALKLRAKVRGITLETEIDPNLPKVAIDGISIREVLNNLVDNAIKYSGTSKIIKISTHLNSTHLVETTVQDFGVGIPSSVMGNLFSKFYRDHHNRSQVGGTGLGLYLSKAIVSAHGGNLWVRSKEGEGSTFGFTILPYSELSEESKKHGNREITQSAHGWIKNHSMYRK
jgi:signal transduction histidine kinase